MNRTDRLRLAALALLVPVVLATVDRWPALLTLAASFALLPVVQDARTMAQARRRVGELIAVLRSAPTDPAETLRGRLGEPMLEIYYRVDGGSTHVTREGRPEPAPRQAPASLRSPRLVISKFMFTTVRG